MLVGVDRGVEKGLLVGCVRGYVDEASHLLVRRSLALGGWLPLRRARRARQPPNWPL